MPELPEVQTVVDTLRPRLLGRRIVRVVHLRPDIVSPADVDFRRKLMRRTVRDIHRRAKRVMFTLDTDEQFYVHLGMTGRLTVEPADAEVMKHTHLIVDLDDGRQLRFRDARRFGGIWWLGQPSSNGDVDAVLGPEPLLVRPAQLLTRLARTRRAIKTALLDQRLIAGLGNIYVDESLFLAGIHPTCPACDLDEEEVKRLNRAVKRVLRRAIKHRGSSLRDYVDADGMAGGFQLLHRVYDRAGEPCPTCKWPIERIVLGGRSTHFCSRCQRTKSKTKSRRSRKQPSNGVQRLCRGSFFQS
jgi:formamidopyrimidine-DNA glycosylase